MRWMTVDGWKERGPNPWTPWSRSVTRRAARWVRAVLLLLLALSAGVLLG